MRKPATRPKAPSTPPSPSPSIAPGNRPKARSTKPTDWFFVNAWGRLADIAVQYLKKGRLIFVEGRLQTDRWDDPKGETHYRTTVIARTLQLLDRRPEEPEAVADISVEDLAD